MKLFDALSITVVRRWRWGAHPANPDVASKPTFHQCDPRITPWGQANLSEVTTASSREQVHKDVSEASEVQPTAALPSRSS